MNHVTEHDSCAHPSTSVQGSRLTLVAQILCLGIRGYQVALSPLLGPACRYYPTCSHYAVEALEKYGARKGGWLALRRLLRCHPFRPGGFDPVP
ncbi:MAG TPA: membrane protein insertion efficiency factor YidD [Gemmatimonadaceae bacterium]|nr:membrane protein insertion efficiency factor YidD [Gemmatimonadaceae bacterium]